MIALRALALAVVLALGAVASPARAEEPMVDPDRPDLTNSARTLPRGGIQLETGAEYSRTRRAE